MHYMGRSHVKPELRGVLMKIISCIFDNRVSRRGGINVLLETNAFILTSLHTCPSNHTSFLRNESQHALPAIFTCNMSDTNQRKNPRPRGFFHVYSPTHGTDTYLTLYLLSTSMYYNAYTKTP